MNDHSGLGFELPVAVGAPVVPALDVQVQHVLLQCVDVPELLVANIALGRFHPLVAVRHLAKMPLQVELVFEVAAAFSALVGLQTQVVRGQQMTLVVRDVPEVHLAFLALALANLQMNVVDVPFQISLDFVGLAALVTNMPRLFYLDGRGDGRVG